MTLRNKKAGGGNPPATTTTPTIYNRPCPHVNRFLAPRHDRAPARPAQPPAPAPTRPSRPADGTVIGTLLLLLCIDGNSLPSNRAKAAWTIAGRWVAELVVSKHPEGAR